MPEMSEQERVEALAQRLVEARKTFRQISDPPPELIPAEISTAYKVDARVEELLGWEPLGWKIAATTPAMRLRLESDEPVRGRSYRRFAHEGPAVLKMSELNGPMVECEFFMTLARDLPLREAPWTRDDIIAAIGEVRAGIEVAESRFAFGHRPGVTGLIADGSSSGQYVFGDVLPLAPDALKDVEVVLHVDGVAAQRGVGADVLGDPVNAVLWLAEALRPLGRSLSAGELISTGSVTGVYYAKPGCDFVVNFGQEATAAVRFV